MEANINVSNLTAHGHMNKRIFKFGSDHNAGLTSVVFLPPQQQLRNLWLPKESPKDDAILHIHVSICSQLRHSVRPALWGAY